MNDLVQTLRSGEVLLMDGAMGTEIRRLAGISAIGCCEKLNLENPEVIRAIHRSYLDAGADVLLTNTFQANRTALKRAGLGSRLSEVWHSAIDLAHLDSTRPYFVLADVGPIENLMPMEANTILDESAGLDGVLVETWTSFEAMRRFADRVDVTLLVSFTFYRTDDLRTAHGSRPEECAEAAMRCGVAALGANCGKEIGMADMVEIARRYRRACDLPIFVRPNAGTPKQSGLRYPRSPATMAAALPDLFEAGVTMIGGCCGTTPAHIHAFRAVVDTWNASRAS